MSKTKSLVITLIVSVGMAFFFLKAIWPVLEVSDQGYNTKSAPAIVKDAVSEASDDEEMEQDIATQEAEVAEPDSDNAHDMMDHVKTNVAEASDDAAAMLETTQQKATDLVAAASEKVEQAASTVMPATPTASSGEAQVYVVTAQGLKYEPLVTKIAVGDTVSWENMSSHDTQAIEGLIPEGAQGWHSSMGESFQHTFTQEGIYIYKCTPHFGAGMGGVIIVGNPVNLEAIKAADVAGAAKRLVKKAIKAAEAA